MTAQLVPAGPLQPFCLKATVADHTSPNLRRDKLALLLTCFQNGDELNGQICTVWQVGC